VKVDPKKIRVVETEQDGEGSDFTPVDELTTRIGQNVADFFVGEIKAKRIPPPFPADTVGCWEYC